MRPQPAVPSHPAHRRVLEAAARRGVALEIVTFPESTHTAQDAARAVGCEVGQIVKSLVFVAPGEQGLEAVVALVSGANRVDVGRLAETCGLPALRRATAQEAGDVTGFVIGGIPPVGHRRPLRAVMDPDLTRFAAVWAAAGTPNAVFRVPVATLRMLADATVTPIAQGSLDAAEPTGGIARDGASPRGAPSGA